MKTMIKKQFVTYEIALKLKELGFDEECLAFSYIDKQIRWYYEEWDKLSTSNFGFIRNGIIDEYGRFEEDEFGNIEEIIAIPLYSQTIDWLRDKHDIAIDIAKIYNGTDNYHFALNLIWEYFEGDYYEAREQAILKCIELLKNK